MVGYKFKRTGFKGDESIMYCVTAACGCNIGKVRGNNEDNFYFDHSFLPQENHGLESVKAFTGTLERPVCFGVFDGMGGEAYGEVAAYLAVSAMHETLQRGIDLPDSLLSVCTNANKRICKTARRQKVGMMGTTAVLLGLKETAAYLVNIGDSRAYLYRAGKLRQISVDHTDQALLASQDIPRRKPRLTQHLGIEPEDMLIEPYETKLEIQNGDLLLLCSDGLTDMVCQDEMIDILNENSDVESSVESLINCALSNGGKDNITVVLCKITEKK